MNENQQLGLIKDFMLAVAPQVTRHTLSMVRHHQVTLEQDEEGTAQHTGLATETAAITLKLAMHLAAQYASCYDSLHSEEYTPPPAKEIDDPPPKPASRRPISRLSVPGQDVPF